MAGIFINYRGTDSAWAVLLDRVLSERFGPDKVFRASRSIRPSEDFIEKILDSIHRSSVLIAVVGPEWLDAGSGDGRRYLDDRADWVRREIAEALAVGIPVIPVLVGDAPRLVAHRLPKAIAQLARCQYLRLHHRNADYDMARLTDELRRLVPELSGVRASGADLTGAGGSESSRSRWTSKGLMALIAVIVVVAVSATIWFSTSRERDSGGRAGGTALRTGRVELGPEDHLDFERGTTGDAAEGLDLYFPTETVPLASHSAGAVDPAVFASAAADDRAACVRALDAKPSRQIDLAAVGVGGSFCVRTAQGNIASVKIAAYRPANPQSLTLEFVTWQSRP
ncbi:toll/interleukin-1 receptor domain-containing protein [Nonomuraea typhae]|uniref:toll/interleukin-1 receptor domain-containing protein n=1 Tax=Nonomuraea typhae TaxID=2603600 RepID=UPI0012FC2DD2|nr:toll/interleukin-1 receptor domain-containing protein [Nonomuraea typhae]